MNKIPAFFRGAIVAITYAGLSKNIPPEAPKVKEILPLYLDFTGD
jgi:hypothetical protein